MTNAEFGPRNGAEFKAPTKEVATVTRSSELPAKGQERDLFFSGTSTPAQLEAARIQADAGSRRMGARTRVSRGR